MASSLESLQLLRSQLELIHEHLPGFRHNTKRLPIIDILDSLESTERTAPDDGEHGNNATSAASGKTSPGSSDGSSRNGSVKDRAAIRYTSSHLLSDSGTPGLRVLRDNVRNDIEQIDRFLARHKSRSSRDANVSTFSTNAPYLIAVWNELVRASPTVAAVDKMFAVPLEKELPKPNSRLLAEFREFDSYLTGSESEDSDCICSNSCATKPEPHKLDNSLLQMGRALLSASRMLLSPDSNEIAPTKITLRLTRLLIDVDSLETLENFGLRIIGPRHLSITSDSSVTDPRIAKTIQELLEMGLDVALGEHEFLIPPELSTTSVKIESRLVPSRQINLDLSVLIALISDITHAPLSTSTEEAYMRYIPTPAERARTDGQRSADNSDSDGEGESIHSRALANQVLRELNLGLLDEIAGRLEPAEHNCTKSCIEFWTSKEVRDRCLHIVEKIGGPAEKRRASALFFNPHANKELTLGIPYVSAEEAANAYWHNSRHSRDTLPSLVPLHIFEDVDEDIQPNQIRIGETPLDPFWINLECACNRLLSSGSTLHPRAVCLSSVTPASSRAPDAIPNGREEIRQADATTDSNEIERAAVTRTNARLTTHTVSTLHRGVVRQWTTLTANRASVKEMVRESTKEIRAASTSALQCERRDGGEEDLGKMETEVAAIWVVEPRSLAETMRGDFVPE
ncbi:uncharacterized protein FOMMEDRAFT_87108 [Fomitiporia mediterranea MF3/22]|uniref:uncharacterized protein n=1 Tax=Fomitiporia mediterranea (strain MF3/22) TaxID=694068 RepID=UPI0004408B9D|nr:uncharacterized protein FOMMEDRAFT_87108 [Fomitiporia mediterranea MF3/22]EJD02039.1 hypothetical protein FOMMEDRAFT_87108 [Fomitiporia mediterranea MF3/22]